MPAETSTQFFDHQDRFDLRDGSSLPAVRIAYETWGELAPDGSNAILLFHALSGSHHAAGINPGIPGIGDLEVAIAQDCKRLARQQEIDGVTILPQNRHESRRRLAAG